MQGLDNSAAYTGKAIYLDFWDQNKVKVNRDVCQWVLASYLASQRELCAVTRRSATGNLGRQTAMDALPRVPRLGFLSS